jgi:predicted Fe-Mo cluster-binding NifX family protein
VGGDSVADLEVRGVIVCVPVTATGEVDPRWGRAERVALAQLEGGRITGWQEVAVAWDALHDVGTEGGHHARVARFLRDHGVEVVVAGHMGPPMVDLLGKLRIVAKLGVTGDARLAVEGVAGLDI